MVVLKVQQQEQVAQAVVALVMELLELQILAAAEVQIMLLEIQEQAGQVLSVFAMQIPQQTQFLQLVHQHLPMLENQL